MALLPVATKTWITTLNQRITFVSLNDTMARYLFGIKAFLKTNGYTVKGSCDGTTGSMDGTDRWASSANAATRFNGAGGAQSWVVLTDGNAVDILLTYDGATDDVALIAFSPGGLYVAAGTANQKPTATDEQVIVSGTTLVNATASADRVWHGFVSSDKKLCRFSIARQGTVVQHWGVEVLSVAGIIVAPAVFAPAVWGYFYNAFPIANYNGTAYSANVRGGLAKAVVSSNPVNMQLGGGGETWGGSSTTFDGIITELQGSQGFLDQPLSVFSTTGGARGKVGNRIDAWVVNHSAGSDGDVFGNLQFVQMGNILFPWDGATVPQMT